MKKIPEEDTKTNVCVYVHLEQQLHCQSLSASVRYHLVISLFMDLWPSHCLLITVTRTRDCIYAEGYVYRQCFNTAHGFFLNHFSSSIHLI